MTTIWKFVLHPLESTTEMPRGAKLLHAAAQGDDICVWAECDPGAEKVRRLLRPQPTGTPLPEGVGEYVGTAHLLVEGEGELVFHVYDGGER